MGQTGMQSPPDDRDGFSQRNQGEHLHMAPGMFVALRFGSFHCLQQRVFCASSQSPR